MENEAGALTVAPVGGAMGIGDAAAACSRDAQGAARPPKPRDAQRASPRSRMNAVTRLEMGHCDALLERAGGDLDRALEHFFEPSEYPSGPDVGGAATSGASSAVDGAAGATAPSVEAEGAGDQNVQPARQRCVDNSALAAANAAAAGPREVPTTNPSLSIAAIKQGNEWKFKSPSGNVHVTVARRNDVQLGDTGQAVTLVVSEPRSLSCAAKATDESLKPLVLSFATADLALE